MRPAVSVALLALPLVFAAPTAAPRASCPGTTSWQGGLYGPHGQTSVSASFPVTPGQSIRAAVVDLATCTESVSVPPLVQVVATVINTDTYDFSTAQSPANEVQIVSTTPDNGVNLELSIAAYFTGASYSTLQAIMANTAVKLSS